MPIPTYKHAASGLPLTDMTASASFYGSLIAYFADNTHLVVAQPEARTTTAGDTLICTLLRREDDNSYVVLHTVRVTYPTYTNSSGVVGPNRLNARSFVAVDDSTVVCLGYGRTQEFAGFVVSRSRNTISVTLSYGLLDVAALTADSAFLAELQSYAGYEASTLSRVQTKAGQAPALYPLGGGRFVGVFNLQGTIENPAREGSGILYSIAFVVDVLDNTMTMGSPTIFHSHIGLGVHLPWRVGVVSAVEAVILYGDDQDAETTGDNRWFRVRAARLAIAGNACIVDGAAATELLPVMTARDGHTWAYHYSTEMDSGPYEAMILDGRFMVSGLSVGYGGDGYSFEGLGVFAVDLTNLEVRYLHMINYGDVGQYWDISVYWSMTIECRYRRMILIHTPSFVNLPRMSFREYRYSEALMPELAYDNVVDMPWQEVEDFYHQAALSPDGFHGVVSSADWAGDVLTPTLWPFERTLEPDVLTVRPRSKRTVFSGV